MRATWLLVCTLVAAGVCAGDELALELGRFGKVPVLHDSPRPGAVMLFVSGDAGISPNVNGMAHEFENVGALVVVIDIWRYLHALDRTGDACTNPAQDFDALAHFVEQQLGYPTYVTPVLVGFSSGATLVYAVLVQAAPGTFRGAIGLGFCPDLPVKKPFCPGAGLELGPGPGGKGFTFLPAAALSVPWIAFQGAKDTDCKPEDTRQYMAKVGGGQLIDVPETDHYFHERRAWIPRFKQVLDRLIAAPASGGAGATPGAAARP